MSVIRRCNQEGCHRKRPIRRGANAAYDGMCNRCMNRERRKQFQKKQEMLQSTSTTHETY